MCLVVIPFTELLCRHDGPLNIRTFVGNGKDGGGGGAKEKEKDGNLGDFLSRETIRLLYSSIKSGRNWRILFSFWVDRPPNFAWKFVYKFDLICENELIKMNRIGF